MTTNIFNVCMHSTKICFDTKRLDHAQYYTIFHTTIQFKSNANLFKKDTKILMISKMSK